VVIGLVGERGREVREFLDDALAVNRSAAVAVVATGDESPIMRRLAPKTAMSIAEFFRDQGQSVLLIIDLDYPLRTCRARCRDGGRRAGGRARLCAERLQRSTKLLERAGPGEEDKARSPAFFRFSSMETISTILSPMPFAARSTDISSSTAPSPTRDDTRPSTF